MISPREASNCHWAIDFSQACVRGSVTDPGQDNFGGSAMGGPSVGQSARWDGAQWVPISQEPHLGQSAMWDGASWVTIQEHDGTRASESPPIPPNQPVEPNSRAAAKKTPWILAGIAA